MSNTRDNKYLIDGNIYIIRTLKSCSLEPIDVVSKGRLLAIRRGKTRLVDVHGEELGVRGKCWNSVPTKEVENTREIKEALAAAIRRSKELERLEEEQKHRGLPKLFSKVHHGNDIKVSICGTYYYTKATAYCLNCKEPLEGTQRLEVNALGKVCKTLPYEPGPGVVQFGKKYMHECCMPVTLPSPEPILQPITDKKCIMLQTFKTMVHDININDLFVRGAAAMFIAYLEE